MIVLHWVPALTVPMHLGLIDRPFMPHNLISAHERPVPLPKFRMAPRLKILMSSGFKKETQTYYPFLSKAPASYSPLPQRCSYGARYPLTGHFYVSLDISLFMFPSRSPVRKPLSMFPNRVPIDRDTPPPESLVHLFIHSFIHVLLPESTKRSPPMYGDCTHRRLTFDYQSTLPQLPNRKKGSRIKSIPCRTIFPRKSLGS